MLFFVGHKKLAALDVFKLSLPFDITTRFNLRRKKRRFRRRRRPYHHVVIHRVEQQLSILGRNDLRIEANLQNRADVSFTKLVFLRH